MNKTKKAIEYQQKNNLMGRNTKKPRSAIGSVITARRLEKRLTMEELAEICGVSKSALWKWETVGNIPGHGTLPKLSKELGIPLEDLLK